MFSSRVPADLSRNRLSTAAERLRSAGVELLDLTDSNPTRSGLELPDDWLDALGSPESRLYAPDPLGLPAARRAVAEEYARHGDAVDPSHIVLTSSTSEAYSLLFKLLCDPGDEILVPQPSYPLFEHLVRLEGAVGVPYFLRGDPDGWAVDLESVHGAATARTRAILVVSPNNPTGSFVMQDELDHLGRVAAAHGAALIVDEVFADYQLEPQRSRVSPLRDCRSLVFGLGGLSKSAALPQVKLAWIAAAGPRDVVRSALARLEIISDTYLSVSAPVQHATRALLEAGRPRRSRVQERVRRNYRVLKTLVQAAPGCVVVPPDAGWSAVIRADAIGSEEAFVLGLLEHDHVLVHPGYFFDFPDEGVLVVSLLPPERVFEEAVVRVLRRLNAR